MRWYGIVWKEMRLGDMVWYNMTYCMIWKKWKWIEFFPKILRILFISLWQNCMFTPCSAIYLNVQYINASEGYCIVCSAICWIVCLQYDIYYSGMFLCNCENVFILTFLLFVFNNLDISMCNFSTFGENGSSFPTVESKKSLIMHPTLPHA